MHYYHIHVTINTHYKPNYYIGSMIRGAFGYALKKVTCINPSYQCEGCFAQLDCLYYRFYEEKNNFPPYRFEIELGSRRFDFGLYLFEKASDGLPYILSALELMLKRNGLGKNRYLFDDFKIKVNNQEVFDGKTFKSLNIPQKCFEIDSFCPDIKLRLLTPLRIKRNNRFLRDEVELEDILRSIYQRAEELTTGKRAFKLEYTPEYKTSLKLLEYKPLLRKSNRQGKSMNMDGIIGEMAIWDLDKRSYKLLKLGEIIGVGKQTVMGLGRVEVEEL